MARGKAWTSNEDRIIKSLVKEGYGPTHIGLQIDRSRDGVARRIKQLGLKDDQNQEIEATEEKPQEIIKPAVDDEPDAPGRYKIRYLIDGVQEKARWVQARSKQRAIRGLLKTLNEADAYKTYDIVKVVEFEPKEIADPIVQEIQQGIEEKFGHIEPKEDAVEEQEPTKEETTNTVEEVKAVEYEGTIELTTQELPLAYYDCERCLTVKGVTLSPEETLKVVDFAVQVWKSL